MTTINSDKSVDISFCLPVYNVCSFLDDCLKSILNQHLEENYISYEIFFIDDGSSDGSYEWLLKRAEEIPQMRVEKNKVNKGVSYTRNRLAREAKGKYIWYVDPDDMLIRNVATMFYQLAEKCNADVLLGDYIRVSESTTESEDYSFSESIENINVKNTKKESPRDSSGKTMSAIWAGLFLKSFLLDNALTMNENMIAQEDTLFYYEFSLKTDKIYKCNVPCYLYRQRRASVMNTRNDQRATKYYLSMKEMLRVYQNHLDSNDFNDKEVLEQKIHHSKQNIAQCLASIGDKKYIKEQLKFLKEEKIYPYKFRKAALKMKPFYQGILTFMLPLKPFFWFYHYVYVNTHKN